MQFLTGGIVRKRRKYTDAPPSVVKFPHRRYSPDEKGIDMKKQSVSRARYLACTAIMSAVAAVLMFLEFSVPFVPEFLKFDFSETPAMIAAYSLGPLSGVIVCLIKNLIHLTATTTAGVGELSNFILGACFVLPAGFLYRYRKTRATALIGALTGALLMAGVSMLTNYYIIYPFYAKAFMPMEVILGMYQAICPSADTLWKSLAIFNLPFTFVKGLVGALITFLLYKPLSPLIKGFSFSNRKKTRESDIRNSVQPSESDDKSNGDRKH